MLSIAIGSSEGFKLFEKNFPNKIELEKKLYSNKPNANFKLFLTKNPVKTFINANIYMTKTNNMKIFQSKNIWL